MVDHDIMITIELGDHKLVHVDKQFTETTKGNAGLEKLEIRLAVVEALEQLEKQYE